MAKLIDRIQKATLRRKFNGKLPPCVFVNFYFSFDTVPWTFLNREFGTHHYWQTV